MGDSLLAIVPPPCCVYYAAIPHAKYPLPSPTIAQRWRGDLPMDLATVDKLLTTTRTVRKRLDLTREGHCGNRALSPVTRPIRDQ